MTSGLKTIIYPVKDLAAAKALFTELLGAEPYVDQPYYVEYSVDDSELYWHVEDIETRLKQLQAAGAEVQQPATDVGEGKLFARVSDVDGNAIGLIQEP